MSWPTVTFLDSTETYSTVINRPAWPYDIEIHMPIAITQAADGSYPDNGFFDPLKEAGDTLGTFDSRILSSSLWRMTADQKYSFNAFMRDLRMGRAENMIMRLGDDHTGFFPFCPDISDKGDYVVRELSRDQSGVQMSPFKWFEDTVALVMVTPSASAISLTPSNQGGLYIGNCAYGLMYPQNGIVPKAIYNFQTALSESGAPYSLDGDARGDSWEASFDLYCNSYNCMAIIDKLVKVYRTQDVPITVPKDYYMFGADQSSYLGLAGTYNAKFLGSERTDKEVILRVTHIGYNQFKIPMNFYMKEMVS